MIYEVLNAINFSILWNINLYVFSAKEHNLSHIHAYYGSDNATINIKTGEILEGSLPKNALRLVREWLNLHKEELLKMWETQEFKKITPLDEEEK